MVHSQGKSPMNAIESKNISVNSCPLHVLVGGEKQNPDIILLHGMKFQAATWQDLGTLDYLAGQGFHALAVDMPGFGKSPACSLTPDQMLEGFVDQETSAKPIILGPSMGGRTALEFAVHHPEKLSGLILVGAVGVEENRDRLAEIKVPTLLIWGSEDQIAPLAQSDILLNEIAGSRRVIIDGAPHPCYLDQSETFHAAIRDFLASLA